MKTQTTTLKARPFSDISTMLGRSMRHIFRSLDTIITVTIMPIAPSSLLWGHVLTSLVSNAISLVFIVLVSLMIGFRSPAGPLVWLAVIGILALFTLTLTWVAVIAGLSAKSVDGASAFSYPIIFLPFISGSLDDTKRNQ